MTKIIIKNILLGLGALYLVIVIIPSAVTSAINAVALAAVLLIIGALMVLAYAAVSTLFGYSTKMRLHSFEKSIENVAGSRKVFIDGQEAFWAKDLQYCEFDEFRSVSLVCKINNELRRSYGVPEAVDNLIILGVIYFELKGNTFTPVGINAFMPKEQGSNLYYTGTTKFRNREPWNVCHFLHPKHFWSIDRAVTFVEDRCNLNEHWIKKAPTNSELVDNMSFTSYSKRLNGALKGYEWTSHGFLQSVSFTEPVLELYRCPFFSDEIHHHCYAIIYRNNRELFLLLPNGRMEFDIAYPDATPFTYVVTQGENIVTFETLSDLEVNLKGDKQTVPFDRLSWAMDYAESTISEKRVWTSIESCDENNLKGVVTVDKNHLEKNIECSSRDVDQLSTLVKPPTNENLHDKNVLDLFIFLIATINSEWFDGEGRVHLEHGKLFYIGRDGKTTCSYESTSFAYSDNNLSIEWSAYAGSGSEAIYTKKITNIITPSALDQIDLAFWFMRGRSDGLYLIDDNDSGSAEIKSTEVTNWSHLISSDEMKLSIPTESPFKLETIVITALIAEFNAVAFGGNGTTFTENGATCVTGPGSDQLIYFLHSNNNLRIVWRYKGNYEIFHMKELTRIPDVGSAELRNIAVSMCYEINQKVQKLLPHEPLPF